MAGKKRKGGKKKASMASEADRLALYIQSVQCPDADMDIFERVFKRHRRRKPLTIREDFCGTAHFAVEWVKSSRKRTAIGVDLHRPTLDWGIDNLLAKEKKNVRERVQLIEANVLDVVAPPTDIVCAMNFSYCIFKDRTTLRRYFEAAYDGLEKDGIFFCELYGGTEAITEVEEAREVDGFEYVWNQADFNPITRETLCHIHFDFPDGSRLERAFTYDWRLWTIPEVRELLAEAGFSKTEIYWEGVDSDGEGEGIFRKTEKQENQEGWLVYIAAIR